MTGRSRIIAAVKRIALVGLATLILGVALVGTPPAPATAAVCQTYTLPSTSYLRLVSNDGRTVIHLQRSVYQRRPTVNVWENGRYNGQWYIPVNVYDIQVRLESRLVLETWLGKVRQVQKEVPIAKVCGNWTAR